MPEDASDSLDALRDAERETYRHIHETTPEVLARATPTDPEQVHERIGIMGIPPKTRGVIRHTVQDFVVEEVATDGSVSTIEPAETVVDLQPQDPALYADVVKAGIGTLEAVTQISHLFGIPRERIGYAGMKDGRALTSQQMSLRGVHTDGPLPLQGTHLFLKPRRTGKGAVAVGQLSGNRFTILVRTEEVVEGASLATDVQELATEGFANFFGPQRFGNRLLNPQLGMLLCRGQSEEAIRVFLCASGPFDVPLHRDLRAAAAAEFGNWAAMQTVFQRFPYTFRHECAVLRSLVGHPENPRAALLAIADQIRFWVYGYASFLVNRLLSEALTGDRAVPDPTPLPLGGVRADRLYDDMLRRDGTTEYARHLRAFPFLVQKSRAIPPWVIPEVHGTASTTAGAILAFTLPKAVYATTFLMFLFRVYEGSPVPLSVRTDDVDTKAVLGTGSTTAALTALNISQTSPETSHGEPEGQPAE